MNIRLCLPISALLTFAAFGGLYGCASRQENGAAAASPVPVRSEVVERKAFRTRHTLLGRVEPAARSPIVAPLAGRITYPPRFAGGLRTGETVRRGELLAAIDNLDRDNAWREAEVALRAARAAADRAERTFAAGVSPEAELERARFDLEAAETRLESLRRSRGEREILAPAGGILRLDTDAPPPGSLVAAGAKIAELAEGGPLEVELWASARDLDQLAVGARVECRLEGGGEVRGEGQLVELDQLMGPEGLARGLARVELDRGMPRPGSGVEVLVEGQEALSITVPEAAIVRRGGVATLFVLESRGASYQARARAITVGASGDGRVVVPTGLQAGERVAVWGADLLADGTAAVEAPEEKAGIKPAGGFGR